MNNYNQLSLFDGKEKFKINKPIRLIELFALCRNWQSSESVEKHRCKL